MTNDDVQIWLSDAEARAIYVAWAQYRRLTEEEYGHLGRVVAKTLSSERESNGSR
jgi:hypothetical protein